MRILFIFFYLWLPYGLGLCELYGQSSVGVTTDKATLKGFFDELKQQPYEYEAMLTKDHYLSGEEGMLIIRVRKGAYNVAGKPIKLVASLPLQLTHYVRRSPSEEVPISDEPVGGEIRERMNTVADEFIVAESVWGDEMMVKTDLAGEVHVKFHVLLSGQHHFSIFFLHPTLGYNEHFMSVNYQSFDPKLLLLYFIVPWLVLVFCYLGGVTYFWGYQFRLSAMNFVTTRLGKYSAIPFSASEDSRFNKLVPMFLGLWFFSRNDLYAFSGSAYRWRHWLAWFVLLGVGMAMMNLVGKSVFWAMGVCLMLLFVYGVWPAVRSNLFMLIMALCVQYYFYSMVGEGVKGFAFTEHGLALVEHRFFIAILFLNIWVPMPLGALAFYTMDQLYYHSPFGEQLFWTMLVAWLMTLSLFCRRLVIAPTRGGARSNVFSVASNTRLGNAKLGKHSVKHKPTKR